MNKIYVPYKQGKPAYMEINGHKLVVLAHSAELLKNATHIDSDSVKEIQLNPQQLDFELANIQKEAAKNGLGSGLILAPEEISFDDLINSLSSELPWLH
jgi:hypothetical protein